MKERTCAVINPRASRGRAHRVWQGVASQLRDIVGPLDAVFTDGPNAAVHLAREALHAGATIEQRKIGDAACAIDLDVFGAGGERAVEPAGLWGVCVPEDAEGSPGGVERSGEDLEAV